MAEEIGVSIGFEGLDADPSQKSYTVKFSASDNEPSSPTKSEEIGLIERSSSPQLKPNPEDFNKDVKDQTVFFEDGERRIDFVLAFQLSIEKKKGQEDTAEKQDKRKAKRDRFIQNCKDEGLEFELQDCSESPDRKTFYYKVHATHIALLKGAEELLLRMPIKPNNLHVSSWRQRFFDFIKVRDPMEPTIPKHLVRDVYFTAPFKLERKENFIGWDDEDNFFTTAQRGAIVWHILQNKRYGTDDDQIGILRLQQNKTFSGAFPLHDSSYKFDKATDDVTKMTDRQLLKAEWSSGWAWYKKQPLDQIRRYFGEKIGIYFAWLGFYTTWLLPVSILGIIIMIYGLSTVNSIDFRNPIANGTCDDNNRYEFYMCPRCDRRCDFWLLRESCGFSYVSQLFDNAGTVVFAIIMAFWAVLFLEFWKRKQYYLQFDWDVLGYEDTEQRARPEFEQRIKRYIRACKTEKAKEKFFIYNPVLDKREYIQPQWWLWPKVTLTFSILFSMVLVVIGIVIAVLIYRLAVAAAIYAIVASLPNGPSIGDIAVSVSGACIQLVGIIIMNKIYEFLAYKLTKLELHRTQTDFEDNFITKMYLFQFVNFYTSLFYIAFFKGNVSGRPGGYNRIGGFRLDECATYGCLLELTIQLAIIFLGKQILNNCVELGVPYAKRFLNWVKHKEETDDDVYARWEKDYDLIPLSNHGLFFEYLELVVQYGFVTLFVAAFPLAPLFALLNNYFEIRIDAHKFVVVLRRPVAERAQDIGAWFAILSVIGRMAIITNAFIIVITGQFIPQLVFRYSEPDLPVSEFMDWSLSEFSVNELVDGVAFPSYSALDINLVYPNGSDITVMTADGEMDLIYMPHVNASCVLEFDNTITTASTSARPDGTGPDVTGFVKNSSFEAVYTNYVFNMTAVDPDSPDLPGPACERTPTDTCATATPLPFNISMGPCYVESTCRFRSFSPRIDDAQSLKYWELQTARLAFFIIFEYFIVVVTGFLAYLVPDVPQSVKNEIAREKLLAYEAIHADQTKSGIVEKTAAELDEHHAHSEDEKQL